MSLLTVAAASALYGCAPDPVVGVLRPKTGAAAAYGRSVGSGIDIAMEVARSAAALPDGFRLVEGDTASTPEVAVAELTRLIREDHVRIFVGGVTSAEADALVPVIEDRRVICLSPTASGKNLARGSRYFYQLCSSDDREGNTAARHLVERAGAREVVVYTDDSAWTRGLEVEFRQHFELNLGGKIVATIHVDGPSWQPQSVDAIHAYLPHAVFIVGHAERILEVLEHLAEVGYDGVRVTTSTFYLADVLGRAGEAAEGVLFPLSAYNAASVDDPVRSFVESYSSRFGYQPDIYAAHGYDAMQLAIRAVVESDRPYAAEIRNALSFKIRDLAGVTGSLSFNDYGEVTRYPIMHCVHNGQVISCASLREKTLKDLNDLLHGAQRPDEKNEEHPRDRRETISARV